MLHKLVLASASPQRSNLLEGLGVTFSVCPGSVDESACAEQDPVLRAQVLARLKADDVAAREQDAWVLGSDTLVVSQAGELLEKPADADDARRMLRAHSGAASTVHSTLCLRSPQGAYHEGLSSSVVHFATLDEEQIDWWIGTGQWRDRSGAFQIDGRGQLMIRHIEGDWSSVVGLPVFLLGELCRQAEVRLQDFGS